MLTNIHYLSDVIPIMANLPQDRFHHRVRLAANKYFPREIVIRKRTNRCEHAVPSDLPSFLQFIEREFLLDEFCVAVAILFFAIACQKIGEPRNHVAIQVLRDDSDGIRFRVGRPMNLLVIKLLQCFRSERTKLLETIERED